MSQQNNSRKVFLYGVGVVAPGSSNLSEFLSFVDQGKSALTPKKSLYNAFLAGTPKFDFSVYKPWLEERHGPKRYPLLVEKSGDLIKYGAGSLIQAISTTPGLEHAISQIDPKLQIQYSTGLGDLPIIHKSARELDKSLFNWNSFWSTPQRNKALAQHLNGEKKDSNCPPHFESFPVDTQERYEAVQTWNSYWAQKSHLLQEYLAKLTKIESEGVNGPDIENAKLSLIRNKIKARNELATEYGYPSPPWESVSSNLLWNIPNLAASQASMLLNLHGEALGVLGACASFGTLVNNAFRDISSGQVDVSIIGAVDASPSDELISAFYGGRLAVMGETSGVPFCDLRGTHISGGACTWVLACEETMKKFNVPHMGIEILGAGVSSDAEHIITPSKEGPKLAMKRAFAAADIQKQDIQAWDMHATGTPGDWNEFMLIQDFVPDNAIISARKGLFGHGMAVCGGWELTAQLLGAKKTSHNTIVLPPTGIEPARLNPKIASLNRTILLDKPIEIAMPKDGLVCGKLGMGVGGVSSCVIAKILGE
ncbi:MAG: beta-ketoacyl synthase N-terminal-like domain-containing protein [Bdellovibrionota bacterium]